MMKGYFSTLNPGGSKKAEGSIRIYLNQEVKKILELK